MELLRRVGGRGHAVFRLAVKGQLLIEIGTGRLQVGDGLGDAGLVVVLERGQERSEGGERVAGGRGATRVLRIEDLLGRLGDRNRTAAGIHDHAGGRRGKLLGDAIPRGIQLIHGAGRLISAEDIAPVHLSLADTDQSLEQTLDLGGEVGALAGGGRCAGALSCQRSRACDRLDRTLQS